MLRAATVDDLDTVLSTSPSADRGALLVGADAFFNSRRDQIVGWLRVWAPGNPRSARVRDFGRFNELWNKSGRCLSAGRSLYGADPPGNRVLNPVVANSAAGLAAVDRLDGYVLGLSGLTHVIVTIAGAECR